MVITGTGSAQVVTPALPLGLAPLGFKRIPRSIDARAQARAIRGRTIDGCHDLAAVDLQRGRINLLRTEITIEPRQLLVEIHAKNRNWQPTTLARADDPIEMPEFGLTCRVGDLYRGTPLDPQSRRAQ